MQNETNSSEGGGGGGETTVIQLPSWADYSFRIVFLSVHVLYFLIVALFRDLQKISLVHMHHTNLIGLLTGIHYCIWIAWSRPNTGDPIVDNVLCRVSETFWALSKVARCYAILVLAIYRLIAVFRINLFKQIVKSMRVYLISILMVWFIPAVIFILSKFSSRSQPGLIMCYDGYSTIIQDSIIYFVLSSFLGYVIPVSLIAIIYIFIRLKLNSVGTKVANTKAPRSNNAAESFTDMSLPKLYNNTNNTNNSNFSSSITKRQKEKGLAKQFIVINLFEMASCVFFVLLSSSNVITIFSTKYYFARQLFRIGNLICQTCIPIASLVYNPVFSRTLNRIKSLI